MVDLLEWKTDSNRNIMGNYLYGGSAWESSPFLMILYLTKHYKGITYLNIIYQ